MQIIGLVLTLMIRSRSFKGIRRRDSTYSMNKKTMNNPEIINWLIEVPISSQLPLSLTMKKNIKVITSTELITIRNKQNGGRDNFFEINESMEDIKKKGIRILKETRVPIINGLNTVVSRLAIFPVPKKATLIKNMKNHEIRSIWGRRRLRPQLKYWFSKGRPALELKFCMVSDTIYKSKTFSIFTTGLKNDTASKFNVINHETESNIEDFLRNDQNDKMKHPKAK
ncbi:hypothetical protein O9G_001687 [Rozella allomycis CSF55]|uniref:Uncharacterized protein n=1 Tax=Rozella allomycis (strain CSF55) TaxID=988480 RepID=A0A075AXI3_ROZAC|nr:hypothetical protein O9G_001687 [Rozella allomycis CSF55]|eukprot:EPZ34957.1 hypothetical protein O9G_001687 [Rozella allomycis CSF55]